MVRLNVFAVFSMFGQTILLKYRVMIRCMAGYV